MDHSHRIVTLTLNPAVDIASTAEAVRPVRKIRTTGEMVDPGGGGVNVARVVRELGGDALALVTAGGVAGRVLEELLTAAGVPHRSIRIAGHTRFSQIVEERASGLEYRFIAEGPELTEGEWRAALAALAEEPGGWLVLSGSLPRGVPADFYALATQEAKARGQHVALDTSGAALRAAMEAGGLDLVKPSLGEFESFVGRELKAPGAVEEAAMEQARRGAARMIAVTLGHRGAVLATAEGGCWRLPAPDVPVRGASGAGDSFVAAMVLALQRGEPAEQALAWGSAAGGATVAALGTAQAKRPEVEALYAILRQQLRSAVPA